MEKQDIGPAVNLSALPHRGSDTDDIPTRHPTRSREAQFIPSLGRSRMVSLAAIFPFAHSVV